MKTIGILFASVLLFAGCKKKEGDTSAGSGSAGSSAMMGSGSDTGMAGSGSAMAGSGSAMAGSGSGSAMAGSAAGSGSAGGGSAAATEGGGGGGGAITSDDDYQSKGMAAVDKMIGIFDADKTDCAKLAKDLDAYADEVKPMVKDAKAYEKAHPKAKKAFDEKMKPKTKEMMAKMGPSMKACGKDKGVQAAMKKMSE
jgi:hypothetical protein